MIEAADAMRVVDTLSRDLGSVARGKANFERLPDTFWGYFARGHDGKGKFGVIVTYSENGDDVDELIKMYESWAERNKGRGQDRAPPAWA